MKKHRYPVLKVGSLLPDTGQIVELGETGDQCTIFLNNGTYYAVGSLCPHQNATLQGAPIVDGAVVCRRHQYRFDLKTGDCLTIGGYGLPTFETTVEMDTVYVSVWEYD